MKWQLFALAVLSASMLIIGCSRFRAQPSPLPAPSNPISEGQDAEVRPLALTSSSGRLPPEIGNLEMVACLHGAMPTGVTVSRSGRIFVCFPQWGDQVDFTVGEIRDGEVVAYPSEKLSRFDPANPAGTLVSVQSVVVDPADRLWILDTGSINFANPLPHGAKLVCVDLKTDKVLKTISFPPNVVLPTTYLNDVRFDLRRGKQGTAYITDSGDQGPNGIIAVNLESGWSMRRLSGNPTVMADPEFVPAVEGESLMQMSPGQLPKKLTIGADGIAISPDGKTLYYCPLISRHLYAVHTDVLIDSTKSDDDVARAVQDLGDRGFASDGLESDAQGRIYLTDYENNGVRVRETDGTSHFIARSGRIIWPDTLSLAWNGYLYFTNNQLDRMARFQNGNDLRQRPYTLFRVKVDGTPVGGKR
jgi:sugar lactone lactonase YvrE